jgi:hypothetical protein
MCEATMARKKTEESSLKNAAKDFLALYGIWTFPLTAGMGSYPGAPDRIGIYKGKPLAIEFKRPTGRLTWFQEEFKGMWKSNGGIFITCRSIEDLAEGLGIKTLLS